MTMHAGVGGVWKTVSQVSVGVAGVWKVAQSGWVGVGGVWKQFLAAILLTDHTISSTVAFPTAPFAIIELRSDGTAWSVRNSGNTQFSGEWLQAGSSADYEVRCTVLSGTLTVSSGAGSWLNLSATRSWGLNDAAPNASVLLEIRPAGGGAALASATIDFSANQT